MRPEIIIILTLAFRSINSFNSANCLKRLRRSNSFQAVKIQGYDEAFQVIDHSAETGILGPDLDEAVRFLEVNSYKVYPGGDKAHAQELWDKAQGSWKLTASTGSHKNRVFHPPPSFLPFSFALIDGDHFGNGIGLDSKRVGLSLLHHAHFHRRHRKMTVTHPEFYLFGHRISFPDFVRPKLLKETENVEDTREKPRQEKDHVPTFVLVAASDKALIARGNQSGGLALWTRLPEDIRQAAYKDYPIEENMEFQAQPQ